MDLVISLKLRLSCSVDALYLKGLSFDSSEKKSRANIFSLKLKDLSFELNIHYLFKD